MNPLIALRPESIVSLSDHESSIPGRVCVPVREGFGCFKKTKWILEDELYATRNRIYADPSSMRFFFNNFDISPADFAQTRRRHPHEGRDLRPTRRGRDRYVPVAYDERLFDTYNGFREWVPGRGWSYHPPTRGHLSDSPDSYPAWDPAREIEDGIPYAYAYDDIRFPHYQATLARAMGPPWDSHRDRFVEDLLLERGDLLKERNEAKEKEHREKVKKLETEMAEIDGRHQKHVEAMRNRWRERQEWGDGAEWPWWDDGENSRKLYELKRELRLRDLNDRLRARRVEAGFADRVLEVIHEQVASGSDGGRARSCRRRRVRIVEP